MAWIPLARELQESQWEPTQHLSARVLPASLTFHFLPSKREATDLCPAVPNGQQGI